MGLGIWMLIVLVAVAGYFGYRLLQEMEVGIRREIEGDGKPEGESPAPEEEPPQSPAESPPGSEEAEKTEEPEEAETLGEVLARVVGDQPGILQTELYELFPDQNRRSLQDELRRMDREGVLVRTKEGGTYRLEVKTGEK